MSVSSLAPSPMSPGSTFPDAAFADSVLPGSAFPEATPPADSTCPVASEDESTNRSFFVTWFLSLTLGFLGADRFFTGRYATGALKLVTLGGLGLWWVIDLVIVMAGGLRYNERVLRGYHSSKEIAWIATGFLIIVGYSLHLEEIVPALLGRLL